MATRFRATHLHQPDGWLTPGYLEIDEHGFIATVSANQPDEWDDDQIEQLSGFVIPGMPNVHSHVHQRGLSGRVEVGSGGSAEENFWTWRERMYHFANSVTPEDIEAIAAQAFIEMVKAGFTSVGEFHYVHQDPTGRTYANPAEMSERILAAADAVTIGLALLPVLYTRGGIDKPPDPEQRRFILDPTGYEQIIEQLMTRTSTLDLATVGLAPHSLRAVSADDLTQTITELASRFPDAPIHIHVAEQTREVDECLAGIGRRPGDWLLHELDLDDRWTFIHATHADSAERAGMAGMGVVAGLCPTTEASLGDGLFPLNDFYRQGGVWGIGTDSNTRISVAEELRVLAYGQRLANHSLLIIGQDDRGEQPGRLLYDLALAGGARSLRQPVGALVPGQRADLVVLDPEDPALVCYERSRVLDGWIFSGTSSAVRDVFVGGRWIVRDRHHEEEARIFKRFRAAIQRLT